MYIFPGMQPGVAAMDPTHRDEVVAMKKGCCESTYQANKIQNIMNQQAAAGRTFVWMQHESQVACCSKDDSLLLVFRVG